MNKSPSITKEWLNTFFELVVDLINLILLSIKSKDLYESFTVIFNIRPSTKEVVRSNMKMAIYPSICSKSLNISYSYVSLPLFVQVLDKNEWKSFRSLISSHRKLRRCGKKLPRYCDTNHDRKISLTEWLNCLNAQRLVAGK